MFEGSLPWFESSIALELPFLELAPLDLDRCESDFEFERRSGDDLLLNWLWFSEIRIFYLLNYGFSAC